MPRDIGVEKEGPVAGEVWCAVCGRRGGNGEDVAVVGEDELESLQTIGSIKRDGKSDGLSDGGITIEINTENRAVFYSYSERFFKVKSTRVCGAQSN